MYCGCLTVCTVLDIWSSNVLEGKENEWLVKSSLYKHLMPAAGICIEGAVWLDVRNHPIKCFSFKLSLTTKQTHENMLQQTAAVTAHCRLINCFLLSIYIGYLWRRIRATCYIFIEIWLYSQNSDINLITKKRSENDFTCGPNPFT